MKDPRHSLPPGSMVVLVAVALGAWVRFTGIGWGLSHPPHSDEQAYVESVNAMLDAGDLDHRYYYYPGLFFYLLAPVIDLLGEGRRHGPEAYLASRVLVAFIASLNIWLAGAVARSFAGAWAAAAAALGLAVSPLSASVAHEVRPDLILETFGLLSLLLYSRETWGRRESVLAGVLSGLAAATKFSGFLFLGGTSAAILLRRAGWGRLFQAALACVAIVLLATPYMILRPEAYLGGRSELDVYFQGLTFPGWTQNLRGYASAAFSFGGVPGAVIAGAGFISLKNRSALLPWLTHFVLTLAVFSLASLVFPRHMLQVTGGLCVLFGAGVAAVAVRSRAAAAILLAATLVLPLRDSWDAALIQSLPSANDRAREWIESNMKEGSVILETRRDAAVGARAGATLGVDRSRFEFVAPENPVRSELRLLMPHSDLLIVDGDRSTTGSLFAGFTLAFDALGPRGGRVLSLMIPANRVRPALLAPSAVSTAPPEGAPALHDGRFATLWTSRRPMVGSEWIEFRFAEPHRLCRVELDMPLAAEDHEGELEVRLDGRPTRSASARASREDQVEFGRPRGQALVFEPEIVQVLRVEQRGVRSDPWVVSETRVYECRDETPPLP